MLLPKNKELERRQQLMSEYDKNGDCRALLSLAYIHLGCAALFADESEQALCYFESAQSLGEGRAAIQRWQDVLCLLGEQAPDYIYQLLSDAYAANKQGFGGSPEENKCWGDCHKHDVLEWLHEKLQPDLYLEIGVDEGLSLARAKGLAVGVDPRLQLNLKVNLPTTSQIISLSSDAYFREHQESRFEPAPGLAFIDGMHLFEFALRDFMNVERHSAPGTLVVIDDIYPCHPVQAARRRKSGAWAGDIWKLHSVLRELRPDLTLVALNTYTTGLLLIAGLDSENKVLHEHYDEQVRRYKPIEFPPQEVLERYGAIPSAHPLVAELVEVLRQSTCDGATVSEVQKTLLLLRPQIVAAEVEFLGQAQGLAGYCGLPSAFTNIGECAGSTVFQIFFPEAQNPHYLERASKKLRLPVTGDWVVYSIDIPKYADLTQHSLRIDPTMRAGTVSIEWIQIIEKVSDSVLYRAELPEEFDELRLSEGLQRVADDSSFSLYSVSSDPQIYLPLLPANRLPKAGEQLLKFEIRMCFNARREVI